MRFVLLALLGFVIPAQAMADCSLMKDSEHTFNMNPDSYGIVGLDCKATPFNRNDGPGSLSVVFQCNAAGEFAVNFYGGKYFSYDVATGREEELVCAP
jgi:hypothetical protein